MADTPVTTSPKIEELRGKLKADPKSRLFYPLAEELRKVSQLEQAEIVLRDGLQSHPGYLSAWISLGRILKERERYSEAVEVLKKALTLDPGNVVAAKLLAQVYLALGEKVEAIKKLKLVHALMPADEEVEAAILALDRELNPDKYAPLPAPEAPPETLTEPVEESPLPFVEQPEAPPFEEAAVAAPADQAGPFAEQQLPPVSRWDATDPSPFASLEMPMPAADEASAAQVAPIEPQTELSSEPFGQSEPPVAEPPTSGQLEMAAAAATSESWTVPPEPIADAGPEAPEGEPSASAEGMAATLTMAELYERQGYLDAAESIYRKILDRDPGNRDAASALERLAAHAAAPASAGGDSSRRRIVQRLENWRARVARS